ncbi:hypothetical protein DL768_004160 [Monosporascus sp. mg162]|nr:hypothetical protein DL768_004160 [Monosporascus sp. mg162]
MALELQEVNSETDFPAIAQAMYEAYEDPPQPCIQIWFPIHGVGNNAREESLQEAARRLKTWIANDPASYWQKVVDTKTGRIAGGALWSIHHENPYANPKPFLAPWFPDDGSREYAEQAMKAHAGPRIRVAQRAHIYLFIIFTHPDYRRQGVGQQIMDWGKAKADQLGLETFLDATAMGKPLYEANAYIPIEDNLIHPQKENPDEKWKDLEEKVGPFTLTLMWRPVGGKYETGKTIKPWE